MPTNANKNSGINLIILIDIDRHRAMVQGVLQTLVSKLHFSTLNPKKMNAIVGNLGAQIFDTGFIKIIAILQSCYLNFKINNLNCRIARKYSI